MSIGSPAFYKTLGFSINFQQQSKFRWQSALATGKVAGYSTIDVQLSADMLKAAINVKFGATNALNKYYYSLIGSPAMGGLLFEFNLVGKL